MHSFNSCLVHCVWSTKNREPIMTSDLRERLWPYLGGIAKENKIKAIAIGGAADHVHMLISIPPKYAVSQVVGFIKGKSAIHLARVYGGQKRNFVGQHFWARGYFVSTVGRNEEVIREYIKNQEAQDKQIDQLNLWK